MRLLNDDVVVLAGGTGRVGGATLTTLVAEGARVALLSRSLARANEAIEDHVPEPARRAVLVLEADLLDAGATDAAVRRCIAHFGRVDAVVNLAGRGGWGPVAATSAGDLRANLDAFVLTAYHLAVPALRAMLAQPFRNGARSRGRIVTVTAGSSKQPGPNRALFGAAKAAVNTLMLGIAREHKADGIVANALVLGGVATDAARDYLDAAGFAAAAQPQEVADVLAFLASDRASGINGALVDLNAREID